MIERTGQGGRTRRLAFAIVIVLAVAACAGGASTQILSAVGDSVGEGGANPAPAASAASTGAPDAGGRLRASYSGNTVGQPNLLIIKTGTLALRVKALDAALDEASAKIAALGGYVSGSQRSGDGEEASATATYRIPAARWDEALVALRGLAEKVLSEQTQTEEVTGQVLDLGARIANLQATEKALQAIMARATKISDVLAVQEQLTAVRGQIEELSTQKKHLEEQAAFSTLTVTYSLQTVPAVVVAQKKFDPATEVDHATASLVDIGQTLTTAGIWFGIVWLPILAVLGIIGLIALFVARRIRRTRDGGRHGTVLPAPEA